MSDMKNWNVLVVEDEADGQEVVQGILGYFDIGTDAVGTAEDAIALLRQRHYNAAVVDIGLPGMTGLELVQYIRDQKVFAHLPCIAITASPFVNHSKLQSRLYCVDLGFTRVQKRLSRSSGRFCRALLTGS